MKHQSKKIPESGTQVSDRWVQKTGLVAKRMPSWNKYAGKVTPCPIPEPWKL